MTTPSPSIRRRRGCDGYDSYGDYRSIHYYRQRHQHWRQRRLVVTAVVCALLLLLQGAECRSFGGWLADEEDSSSSSATGSSSTRTTTRTRTRTRTRASTRTTSRSTSTSTSTASQNRRRLEEEEEEIAVLEEEEEEGFHNSTSRNGTTIDPRAAAWFDTYLLLKVQLVCDDMDATATATGDESTSTSTSTTSTTKPRTRTTSVLETLVFTTYQILSLEDDERCQRTSYLEPDSAFLFLQTATLMELNQNDNDDESNDMTVFLPEQELANDADVSTPPQTQQARNYTLLFQTRALASEVCFNFTTTTTTTDDGTSTMNSSRPVPSLFATFTDTTILDDCACKIGPTPEAFVQRFQRLLEQQQQRSQQQKDQPVSISTSETNKGDEGTTRRHDRLLQQPQDDLSTTTTMAFPFPLGLDRTDVHSYESASSSTASSPTTSSSATTVSSTPLLLIANINQTLQVTQVDFAQHCPTQTTPVIEFNTTVLLTLPNPAANIRGDNTTTTTTTVSIQRQIQQWEQGFLQAYQQANHLNERLCDPVHRIVLSVSIQYPYSMETTGTRTGTRTGEDCSTMTTTTATTVNQNENGRSHKDDDDDDDSVPSTAPSQAPSNTIPLPTTVDLFAFVTGTCIGCSSSSSSSGQQQDLFDATKSTTSTSRRRRQRRHLQDGDDDDDIPLQCLCPSVANGNSNSNNKDSEDDDFNTVERRGPTVQEFVLEWFTPALCLVELDPVPCPLLPEDDDDSDGENDDDSSKGSKSSRDDDDALLEDAMDESAPPEYYAYFRSKLSMALTLDVASWNRLVTCNSSTTDSGAHRTSSSKSKSNSKDDLNSLEPAVQLLEELFLSTYNGLLSEYCDPLGRFLVYSELLDSQDVLYEIRRQIKKNLYKQQENGEEDFVWVSIDVRFLVVRRCRRGMVVEENDDEEQETCDGLFWDTITNDHREEVSRSDKSNRRRKNYSKDYDKLRRRHLRQVEKPSTKLLGRGVSSSSSSNDKDFETILSSSFDNTKQDEEDDRLYAIPPLLGATLSRRVQSTMDSSSSVYRRGLLVSPPCHLDQCYCPTDAIARRPPKLEVFETAYPQVIEYATSSSNHNCTNPFPMNAMLLAHDDDATSSISSIDGICPWKPNPEPEYTLNPTSFPSEYPSEFPTEMPEDH